MKLPAPVKST